MPDTVSTKLNKPITAVKILDDYGTNAESADCCPADTTASAEQALRQDLAAQKTMLTQDCQILKSLIAKFEQLCEGIFTEHREEIAKLSVEISRKILVQKVQNGDYKIETIVKEALKNAPTCQDVVVHLNPEDLEQFHRSLQADPNNVLSGIRFVSDPNVGRAECVLESPKGIIKSLLNEHLERIGQALSKVE